MVFKSLMLGAILSLASLAGAEAATVTGTFAGTITVAPTSFSAPSAVKGGVDFSAGNTVTGTFTYSTAALSELFGDSTMSYSSADNPLIPFTVSLTVNGVTLTSSLSSQLYTYVSSGSWDVGALGTAGDLFGIVANEDVKYVGDVSDPGSVWFSIDDPSGKDQAWMDFIDGTQALISVTSLDVTTVPEPLALALLAAGLAGVGVVRRRLA